MTKPLKHTTADKSCQLGSTLNEYLGSEKKDQACGADGVGNSDTLIDDQLGRDNDTDTENGSSEDAHEVNVGHSFSDIKSCALVKEIERKDPSTIWDACFMPDGQLILCTDYRGRLKMLDVELNVKMELCLQKQLDNTKHVALIDSQTIIVSLSNGKKLQFISIAPKLRFGQEIHLSYRTYGLVYHKEKIYLYTHCVDETAHFKSEGFQLLSLSGQLLNTIPVYDNVDCFCVNKQADILYFGCRLLNGSTENFFKCVTLDGEIKFQNPYPKAEPPNFISVDYHGNLLIDDPASLSVMVVRSDESDKVLARATDKYKKVTTVCCDKIVF